MMGNGKQVKTRVKDGDKHSQTPLALITSWLVEASASVPRNIHTHEPGATCCEPSVYYTEHTTLGKRDTHTQTHKKHCSWPEYCFTKSATIRTIQIK